MYRQPDNIRFCADRIHNSLFKNNVDCAVRIATVQCAGNNVTRLRFFLPMTEIKSSPLKAILNLLKLGSVYSLSQEIRIIRNYLELPKTVYCLLIIYLFSFHTAHIRPILKC